MGKKCFVPNCTSRYRSRKIKFYSLIKATLDSNWLAIWDHVIPRSDCKLQPGDCVCRTHFGLHLISKTYYVEHEGTLQLNAPKR